MTCSRLDIRGFRTKEKTTTVKLEPEFWQELEAIASLEGKTLNALVRAIDHARGLQPRASAIRVFVLKYWRLRAKTDLVAPAPPEEMDSDREPIGQNLQGVFCPLQGGGETAASVAPPGIVLDSPMLV